MEHFSQRDHIGSLPSQRLTNALNGANLSRKMVIISYSHNWEERKGIDHDA